MKCPNCNNELSEETRFCNYCGTPINQVQSPNQPTQNNVNISQPVQSNSDVQYSQNIQNNNNVQYSQPVANNSKSKYKRPLSVIGFIVVLVSLFLPYCEANYFFSTSVALIDGDGLLLVPFIIVGIILAALNKVKGTIVPIVVLVIYFVYSLFNINSNEASGFLQFSTGFYIMVLGIIMTIAAFIMRISENKK